MTQKEYKDNQELKALLEEKMQERYDVTPRVVALQVEKEYKLIKKYGIARKLLDLFHLTKFAKEQELAIRYIGPINGSIIAYLLGLTGVNPLQYGLIFERWNIENPNVQLTTTWVAEGYKQLLQTWVAEHTEGYTEDELYFMEMQELTLRQECLKLLKRQGINVSFDKKFNDEETWTLLASGMEEYDIPFIENDKERLHQLKPTNILELTPLLTSTTSYVDFMDDFSRRCKVSAQVTHCDKILEETRGYIFYQEQLMQIFHDAAGYSYAEANELRKIMAKRMTVRLRQELENKFLPGCVKRGFTPQQAREIWEDCLSVNYVLSCKAYFLPVAIDCYYMAYLKARYPKEYAQAYAKSKSVNQYFFIQSLFEVIEELKKEILCFNENTRLEGISKVFFEIKKLKEVVQKAKENSVEKVVFIPPDLYEQAKAFMEANPTCTVAQLQRELKAAYPMTSKLWEEFSK